MRLALVTGNFEPVARLKLARAGIGRYFPSGQGGFGSDSEDRAALPAIARRRAGPTGIPYPRERTIVIGDTPRDIACARADERALLGRRHRAVRAPRELTAADGVADRRRPSCARCSRRALDASAQLGARLSAWAWGTARASSGPRPGRA